MAWIRNILLAVAFVIALCAVPHAAEIRVGAASSLAGVLEPIGAQFQSSTGTRVVFSLGASNQLARQIEEGARLDLFFSADEASMDKLEQRDLLAEGSRRDLLSNQLVVIAPAEGGFQCPALSALTNALVRRIALADPQGVPAGVYAKKALESAGLWNVLKNKVIPCENVRAALAAVRSGNVDAGIVYATDAKTTPKVKVLISVIDSEVKIRYPVAILKATRDKDHAQAFLRFLAGADCQRIFREAGFVILP